MVQGKSTSRPINVAWSPTGRELAFTSDRSGNPQIYVMDADGGNVRRLTFDVDYTDSPVWSPKGDRIAFVTRVGGGFDIWTSRADGTGAHNLKLPTFDIKNLPYLNYDPKNRDENAIMYPHMDGKRVFHHAVRNMVMSSQQALAASGMTWGDIDWFVPHQANLRINEKVVEVGGIPPEKVLNTIQFYGNTTAATVPFHLKQISHTIWAKASVSIAK